MKLGQRYTQWLRETYPRAFSNKRRPPLIRGVYNILLADPQRPDWATDAAIQWALARWTRHPRYRKSVATRRQRRTLYGDLLERCTLEEAKRAKETLEVSAATTETTIERGGATHDVGQGILSGTETTTLPRGTR